MDSSQSSQGSGGMLEMSVGSHRVFLPPECPTFLEMDIITESTITGDEEITESVDFPRGMTLTVLCGNDSLNIALEDEPASGDPQASIYVRGSYKRTCAYHERYSFVSREYEEITDGSSIDWDIEEHEESELRSDQDYYDYETGQCEDSELSVTLELMLPASLNEGNIKDHLLGAGDAFASGAPQYWKRGNSDWMREPQKGDTVYELPLQGSPAQTPQQTADDDAESDERPRKRAKKSSAKRTSASKAKDAKTIKIGFSKLPMTKKQMDQIMKYLESSQLPTTSIIGYLLTLCGGILHMSYPPTLDQLVLYCHVIHLHRILETKGGIVEATLNTVIFSLTACPVFGQLSPGVAKALILRIMVDLGAPESFAPMLAPLFRFDQCAELLQYLGLAATSSLKNADFFVRLSAASLTVLNEPLKATMR